MAGLGEVCSHVGAVLFYVEAVHRVKGSSTCTQMPCSWIVPKSVKEIPYSKVADLTFTMPKVAKIQHTKSRVHIIIVIQYHLAICQKYM